MQAVNLVISIGVISVLFALIFKYMPDAKIDWRDVWIGAVMTALLFTIGKFGIGLYLGHSSYGSSYGAAGSLVDCSGVDLLFGTDPVLRRGVHASPRRALRQAHRAGSRMRKKSRPASGRRRAWRRRRSARAG